METDFFQETKGNKGKGSLVSWSCARGVRGSVMRAPGQELDRRGFSTMYIYMIFSRFMSTTIL